MSSEVKTEVSESSEPEGQNGKTESTGRTRRPRKGKPLYSFGEYDSASEEEEDTNEVELRQATQNQFTGYTLYCHENREEVLTEFSDLTPSKLNMKLAKMWGALPPGIKRSYSCRARQLKSGGGGSSAKKARPSKKIETSMMVPQHNIEEMDIAFLCEWERCDFQFEAVDECAQHILDQHLRPLCVPETDNLLSPKSCRWQGCMRRKRCSLPFVTFSRIFRHLTEEHVLVGKRLPAKERSEHYIPRQSE